MGGKHKQAQRTKNNARPSSSGRSAELLGASIPTFVGFSAVKDGGYVPVLPGFSVSTNTNEEIDSNLDTNFQLVLKKMNKKDSTTKLKALQEFSDLICKSEPEAVKAVLTFWPRIYWALSIDTEHRVREAAHHAQRAIVLKVRRNIAPYLKQLVGPWFISQHDSYAPAASAAQQAFQDAFPPNKIIEVIIFCQEEILNYIYDNLSLYISSSKAKSSSTEEADLKIEKILTSNLQSYTYYLQKLNSEQISAASDLNKKIVSNASFWKLAKHNSPPVRTAWFNTLSMLCHNAPFLLEDEKNHMTTAVMANLDETDPTVLPAVWEAALLTLSTVKEWWTHVSVDKLVLPKLWRVLREGGQGSATTIYPNLLLLISHFPPISDVHLFYNNFFENMLIGLKQRSILQSRSEIAAVATSFLECLRYVIMKNQANEELCIDLLKIRLMPAIDWVIYEGHSVSKVFFCQLSILIHYWSRHRNTSDFPIYNKLLEIFWIEIDRLFESFSLTSDTRADKKTVAEKLNEFLFCLKRNDRIKTKKQNKVQFDAIEKVPSDDSSTNKQTNKPENVDITYLEELNKLIFKTCVIYKKLIEQEGNFDIVPTFCHLIQEFNSKELFEHLCDETTEQGHLLHLHQKVFTSWLKTSTYMDEIINLIFTLFNYFDSDEKKNVLESFSELPETVLLNCVTRGLAHPQRDDPHVRDWLMSPKITALLADCARLVLNNPTAAGAVHMPLLRLACAQNVNGELLISNEACKEIINIFCEALLNPADYPESLDTCARFMSVMSAFLYSDANATIYGDQLLLSLFSLSCNSAVKTDILSSDTLWEVDTAWQDAISVFDEESFLMLVEKFATIIRNEILSSKNIDALILERTVKIIEYFLKVSKANGIGNIYKLVNIFVDEPKAMIDSWLLQLINLNLHSEIINGTLSFIDEYPTHNDIGYFDNVGNIESVGIDCKKLTSWMRLVCVLLVKLFEKKTSIEKDFDFTDDEDDENNETETQGPFLQDCKDEFTDMIARLIHSFTVIRGIADSYQNTKYYNEMRTNVSHLKQRMKELVESLPEDTIIKITDTIISKARTYGCFWAKAIYLFHTELMSTNADLVKIFKTSIKKELPSCEVITEVGWLHIVQVFGKHLSFDHVDLENKNQIASLVIMRAIPISEDTAVQTMEALGIVKAIKSSNEDALLFDKNISSYSWDAVVKATEIIRLLNYIVRNQPYQLSSVQWDFIEIGLASWIYSIGKSLKEFTKPSVSMFIGAVFDLFSSVSQFIVRVSSDVAIGPGYESLVAEWKEIVAEDVNKGIVTAWMHIIGDSNKSALKQIPLLNHILPSTSDIASDLIFSGKCGIKWEKFVFLCADCFQQRNPPIIQSIAFEMLMHISGNLVAVDAEMLNSDSSDTVDKLTLNQFKSVLELNQDIVQTVLMDFRLGEESAHIEPFTDSFSYTNGYLLLWAVMFNMLNQATSNVKYQYGDWIRNGDYVKTLMQNLLRLMPIEHLYTNVTSTVFLFDSQPAINTLVDISDPLERLSCWIFRCTLEYLPALVRQWWTGTEARVARAVDKLAVVYVSPQLCWRELQNVTQKSSDNTNMTVKTHPGSREVIATYSVDDARMELSITLAPNHPLGPVSIECNQQIGASTQLRNSLMQLSLFLTHQNGSLWDGLSLWKSNLDRKFEGVEECYICFSVIHAGTYQLPKLSCRNCRKKFHSACLYKWFSTSNKSTCPICRHRF